MSDAISKEAVLEAAQWKVRELPGFIGTVGPLWTRRESDRWVYGFLVTSKHLNPAGMAHGGILTTLIDHAASAVAWESTGRRPCVTVQLDTHFINAVREGDFVEARVGIAQATRSLLFMNGNLAVEGKPVLGAQAILKVL